MTYKYWAELLVLNLQPAQWRASSGCLSCADRLQELLPSCFRDQMNHKKKRRGGTDTADISLFGRHADEWNATIYPFSRKILLNTPLCRTAAFYIDFCYLVEADVLRPTITIKVSFQITGNRFGNFSWKQSCKGVSVLKANLPWMKTRFQKILPTCIPPRNTRLERMSMAVEKAERRAMQRLSIAAEKFRSWEISKQIGELQQNLKRIFV